MAGEVQLVIPSLPTTAYFVVRNAVGEFWNTSGTPAFEAYNAANWTAYDVALSQSGASQHYAGTFPSTIPAGVYSLTAYVQAGGSPAVTDSLVGSDAAFYWTGSVRQSLNAVVATSVTGSVGSVTAGVTVTTNNDKTGYSLTQTFPTNFAALDINASGHVSRVTLVDTTTTNTDMRGTDNAATAANLATVAGYLDTEIAEILADTNELQTDWADGGRLDLILDARASQTSVDDLPTNAELATALASADDAVLAQVALVKAKTDNLPSDPADQSAVEAAITAATSGLATSSALSSLVTTVGIAGVGLTEAGGTGDQLIAVPWNAAWDAEVQSEVDDALTAFDFSGKSVGDVIGKVLGGGSGTITGTGVRAVDSSGNAIAPASDLTLVLADTNELQTDWVNGGRLDLILDARASQTSVDDIPTVSEFNARTLASADYATPTNITAGTITTVTNLTNAPTVGDFTATMKTSITTAATAATPTVTAGTVTDKTGYALTAAYDAAKTAATQTSVDTIDGNVDLILADTAELQNDWVNGGRLDLILDARASETNATVNKAAILSVVADVYTDVNTILTRIPAALFAGITSLAQWLGLIAGKQTGNSTARTELRATGAGSGTFDETTDSQEALRDRGDVAWISGAGASAADIAAALASQPIVIQSPTTTNGTLDLVQGMDYYTADGREIEFTFVRDYVPSSCKLTIAAGAVVTVTSTDISESSGSGSGRFHVRFELPRTTGDDLEAGTGTFEVYSIVGTRQVPEIAEGVATIRRRLTA